MKKKQRDMIFSSRKARSHGAMHFSHPVCLDRHTREKSDVRYKFFAAQPYAVQTERKPS